MTAEYLNSLMPDKDGNVTVKLETLKTLVAERESYKKDIDFIVSIIKRLLTQLGILTPDGEIRFKVSALVRAMSKALLNSGATEKEFSYLGEVGGIIERYTQKPASTEV